MIIEKNFKGKKAFISYDDDDHEMLSNYVWKVNQKGYVEGYLKGTSRHKPCQLYRMHRLVMSEKDSSVFIDHADGNKLNCHKVNLRRCNNSENHMNYFTRNPDTGYYGVRISKVKRPSGKIDFYYRVDVRVNKKKVIVGHFKDPKEAAIARDNFVKIHHGEFATLNFPTL